MPLGPPYGYLYVFLLGSNSLFLGIKSRLERQGSGDVLLDLLYQFDFVLSWSSLVAGLLVVDHCMFAHVSGFSIGDLWATNRV